MVILFHPRFYRDDSFATGSTYWKDYGVIIANFAAHNDNGLVTAEEFRMMFGGNVGE